MLVTTKAATTGAALVSALAGGRGEKQLAFGRLNLSAALLALGWHEQARPHLRDGWAQAPLFDAQPFYADYLAELVLFEGRFEPAARLAGYADAGNARRHPLRDADIEAHAFTEDIKR